MNTYFHPDPKPKTSRDKYYLQYIREHPCHVCGYYLTIAAHTRTGGERIKCSDYLTMPLCVNCHEQQHKGFQTFAEKHSLDYDRICIRYMEKYIQRLTA